MRRSGIAAWDDAVPVAARPRGHLLARSKRRLAPARQGWSYAAAVHLGSYSAGLVVCRASGVKFPLFAADVRMRKRRSVLDHSPRHRSANHPATAAPEELLAAGGTTENGRTSVADKINLSYYLIHLGRAGPGRPLLEKLRTRSAKRLLHGLRQPGGAYLLSSDLRSADSESTDQGASIT